MKKIILSVIALMMLFSPMSVSAVNLGGDLIKDAGKKAGFNEKADETSFAEIVGLTISILLQFVGVIFTTLMVYAGFLWMTARGEEDQVKKAQTIIRQSLIGLILTLGAYSITNFIVPKFVEKASGDGVSKPAVQISL